MSIARKCNKCKRCFDPYTEVGRMCHFGNPIFQNANDVKEHNMGWLLFEEEGPEGMIDLCPECSKKFLEFFGINTKDQAWNDDCNNKDDSFMKNFIASLQFDIDDALNKAHHQFPFFSGDTDGD